MITKEEEKELKKPAGLITKVFQIFNNLINDRRLN